MQIDGHEIVIAAPSYRRPQRVETLDYLPSARIYVAESEAKAYLKNNPADNIVAVEDQYQGNLCRIRNRILDLNSDKIVVLIDDDFQHMAYWERNERHKIETEAEFMAFVYKYTRVALDLGVKLWGVNVNCDKQCYREYTPFSMLSYIGGPFMVHLMTDLRFDERLPLKEDYDFTLQNLNRYRKVLRLNKYYYIVKQAKQAGGCATYRNVEREREQFKALQKKWGADIVKADSLGGSRNHLTEKVRKFDINPVITAPIPGV